MVCKDFQKLIHDFIYDRIDYSDELEEFINHANECSECMEELELYYSIHRGFDDVESPVKVDEILEPGVELRYVMEFYEKYFRRQNLLYNIGKAVLICFTAVIFVVIIYFFLVLVGIKIG